MTMNSRSASCTWIHWCPIVYPLSVISFVFEDAFWWTKGNQKDISRRAWQLFGFLYYMCNYHYDENYTMGPNSTSLFILTLRKLQTIRQQGNTYLLLPSILGPHFLPPAHGWWLKSCVTKCVKIYGRLKAGILFLFLIWNDRAFINSLQAGASETLNPSCGCTYRR